MRISDWSSDMCSSDLDDGQAGVEAFQRVRDLGVAGFGIPALERPEPAAILGDTGVPEHGVESGRGRVRIGVVPVVLHRRVELPDVESGTREIGRASCRERVCQYV